MASAVGFIQEARTGVEELADEAEEILKALGDSNPGRERLVPLAGPNDVVQLILDPRTLLLLGAAAIVGTSALKKIGDHVGDAVWRKMTEWVRSARARRVHATLAIPTPRRKARNAGIPASDDPEELKRQIAALVILAPQIEAVIQALTISGASLEVNQTTDCSVKLELVTDADGNDALKLRWHIFQRDPNLPGNCELVLPVTK